MRAVGAILLGVLGEAEAERRVEVDGALHLRRKHIEVVEPLRLHAFVAAVLAQQGRALFHLEVELERQAARIERAQCAALERCLDEGVLRAQRLEEVRGLVEVLLARDLEAEMPRVRYG